MNWLEGEHAEGAPAPAAVDLDHLNTLQEKITGHSILGVAILHRVGDRLIVSMPGDILFPVGSAVLRADARLAAGILAARAPRA